MAAFRSEATPMSVDTGLVAPCDGIRTFPVSPNPSSPVDSSTWRLTEVDNMRKEYVQKLAQELVGEQFLMAFAEHMESYKPEKQDRKVLFKKCTPDERNLTRLAWVMEKLNPARVCVAALLTKNNHIYLYANQQDTGMVEDCERLVKALQDVEERNRLVKTVEDSYVNEIRTSNNAKNANPERYKRYVAEHKEIAERRVEKMLSSLSEWLGKFRVQDGTAVQENATDGSPADVFRVHRAKSSNKHGEMRAVDACVSKVIELRNEDAAGAAEIRGFVGISKLCCGKCMMALIAAATVENVDFYVQGAHFQTYDTGPGWPVPAFLMRNDNAMRAFLGEKCIRSIRKIQMCA